MIIPISASQEARIMGVNHWHPAIQLAFHWYRHNPILCLSQSTIRNTQKGWVLVAVILPTQEAEIRRIQVQSQPRQIVLETLLKKIHYKKRAGGVAQGGEGPEFKLQHTTKKKTLGKYHLGLELTSAMCSSFILSPTCYFTTSHRFSFSIFFSFFLSSFSLLSSFLLSSPTSLPLSLFLSFFLQYWGLNSGSSP
jgi:hypothetical protein